MKKSKNNNQPQSKVKNSYIELEDTSTIAKELNTDKIEEIAEQPDTEDVEPNLKDAEHIAISTLKATHEALMELSICRLGLKLSNSRVVGVARELKELMKVMSVYEAV